MARKDIDLGGKCLGVDGPALTEEPKPEVPELAVPVEKKKERKGGADGQA